MRIDSPRLGSALPRAALVVLAGVLLALAPVSAQLPASARLPQPAAGEPGTADLPAARAIIDRHVDAIGGRQAILGHSSTHAVGTVSIPSAGMSGTIEIFAKKPNRTLVKMTIAGLGETVEAFNGSVGWQISPVTGPALLEGKELAEKVFDADFYDELHDAARYESMTTVERTTFDGRSCYKVRLVRKGGGEDFEFYDAATGLKAGTVTTRETPMGTVNMTLIESEYRKFGDLLQATKATVTAMGLQQVMVLNTVEYDTVADSVFEPPAAIKALLK